MKRQRNPRQDFEQFVDQHRSALRAYLAGRNDVQSRKIDPDDALQETLVRIWRQWEDWPTDPQQRKSWAFRAAQLAAIDVFRVTYGKDGAKEAISINWSELENSSSSESRTEAVHRLGQLVARQASERHHEQEVLDRAVLTAALASLNELEKKVLGYVALGEDDRETVARKLGINLDKVKNVLAEARAVLRTLISHSITMELPEIERQRLYDLLDGKLKGNQARLARRHLENCQLCQQVAAMERRIEDSVTHIFMPLPIIVATLKPTAIGGVGAGGKAGILAGKTGANFLSGGGSFAGGGIFGISGAKLAVCASLTVVGIGGVTGATVYQLKQDQKSTRASARKTEAMRAQAPQKTRPVPGPENMTAARQPAAAPVSTAPLISETSSPVTQAAAQAPTVAPDLPNARPTYVPNGGAPTVNVFAQPPLKKGGLVKKQRTPPKPITALDSKTLTRLLSGR